MDLKIYNEGSIIVLTPLTEDARNWIDENCNVESWQWMGGSLAIDYRFAEDIIYGLADAGFEVE
jgi:hypothetical protein